MLRQILIMFPFSDKESDIQKGKPLAQAIQLVYYSWGMTESVVELQVLFTMAKVIFKINI